jgi:uncharacterized coiled-coil DUF342 family protein
MNRSLQIVNFIGVVALGILCVVQWQINRRSNLDGITMEKQNRELAAKVTEQKKATKGLTDDLDDFRRQLTKASVSAAENRARADALENENSALISERDQLKTNVAKWAEAVTQRDKQIAAGNDAIKELTATRDKAISRFNDLAERHNALVKEFNEMKTGRTNTPSSAVE